MATIKETLSDAKRRMEASLEVARKEMAAIRTGRASLAILDGVKDPDRLGVCFDTCHVFAAGYAMETEKDYKATMRALNKTIGVKQVKAFHLNDSKKPLGSRVDRNQPQVLARHTVSRSFSDRS